MVLIGEKRRFCRLLSIESSITQASSMFEHHVPEVSRATELMSALNSLSRPCSRGKLRQGFIARHRPFYKYRSLPYLRDVNTPVCSHLRRIALKANSGTGPRFGASGAQILFVFSGHVGNQSKRFQWLPAQKYRPLIAKGLR